MVQRSILCFLGAGYSSVAGVPLAKDLLRPSYLLAMSVRSHRRFTAVREHYENWQQDHPTEFPEQYMGLLYNRVAGSNAPQWDWVVEYVSAVIASAGTPPSSLNRNPRYSNRINRPSESTIHRRFWDSILRETDDLAVVTTNYDILIERALRHRPMRRPPSPGCFYGGLPRPQHLKGAAQPFSRWSPERLIEMTGRIPVFKLHGSLNWSLTGQTVITYQDMRPAFRHGGTAAIVPPIPEKLVPTWLKAVWDEATLALHRSDVWIACGYSAPRYDTEVLHLLRDGGGGRPLTVLLLSRDSETLQARWKEIVPEANVIPLPRLPEGIKPLADHLRALRR
jgi:SIR2-like domain